MISWASASPDLSNVARYPTFTRTVGPYSMMAGAYLAAAKRFEGMQYLYGVRMKGCSRWPMQLWQRHQCTISPLQAATFKAKSGKIDKMQQLSSSKDNSNVIFVLSYCQDCELLQAADELETNGDIEKRKYPSGVLIWLLASVVMKMSLLRIENVSWEHSQQRGTPPTQEKIDFSVQISSQ